MAKPKIKELVAEQLEGFLAKNGYELYNVEFIKEGRDWFLRVYIDRAENSDGGIGADDCKGIGTDDCEKVSRYLSARLDELDPIEQNYYLEVSSPGMDRALLKESDYTRYAGRFVDVALYQGLNGKKNYFGKLEGLRDGVLAIIDEKENRIEIPMEKVAKTRLAVIF
jgi:ribosome maturation factor RimP